MCDILLPTKTSGGASLNDSRLPGRPRPDPRPGDRPENPLLRDVGFRITNFSFFFNCGLLLLQLCFFFSVLSQLLNNQVHYIILLFNNYYFKYLERLSNAKKMIIKKYNISQHHFFHFFTHPTKQTKKADFATPASLRAPCSSTRITS